MLNWFRDRFAAGTPFKNINTVAPFLARYLHESEQLLDSVSRQWAEWLWTACRVPRKTVSSASFSTR
jgi:unsaturated rhamnogalacturonyl hydrolase